ncbi:common central domain of tyrosinase-domain-containing protein [Rostrohypoxylon terebratum]|nr:common central domain of tyrosinase-domain-containing protein [Rostrohypoxylon terebratum]
MKNASQNEKKKWRREAMEWRLPYWDFARFATNGDGSRSQELRLPILATIPEITVRAFGSEDLVAKPNPFNKFETQNLMERLRDPFAIRDQEDKQDGNDVTLPFGKCKSTTRYGLMKGYHPEVWANAGQNWQLANVALNEYPQYQNEPNKTRIPILQDKVYRLLTKSGKSWEGFSSTKDHQGQTQADDANNLEDIHNSVHNFVGRFFFDREGRADDLKLWGSGHMSNVPVAAFDPIFWLHHCNVDRLTAIWQSLNDETWFVSNSCATEHLEPFHKDEKQSSFTSNDVRDWRALGYDYAITQEGHSKENIKKEIDCLYGNQTVIVNEDKMSPAKGDVTNLYLGLINIFFGDIDERDFYDKNSKNFVGSVFNFSTSIKGSNCGNCKRQQQDGVQSVAQLPATMAVNHYLSIHGREGEYPEVHYVVVNHLGKPVDMKVQVELHGSDSPFAAPPKGGRNGDKGGGDYSKMKDGMSYYNKVHQSSQASPLIPTR